MSDIFDNSREYRFLEWRKYTQTRPYSCQGLMKNFWQCFDNFRFIKNFDEVESKTNCLEKFNYEECLSENKEKLFENWIYNTSEKEVEEQVAEEEE